MWACYILHNIMPTEKLEKHVGDLSTYSATLRSVNFSQRFFESIHELECKSEFSPKKIKEKISILISELS